MAKKKIKKYSVRLWATLPASATIEVEAESAEDARQLAMENSEDADWNGADYDRPDGCTVEAGEATEITG